MINKTDYESGGDSEPSLSPLNSDDLALDDESDSLSSADFDKLVQPLRPPTIESGEDELNAPSKETHPMEYRNQFEELQSRQYWRDDWQTDASLYSAFDLGDPSTLGLSCCPSSSGTHVDEYFIGPTLSTVLAQAGGFQNAHAMLKPEVVILSLSWSCSLIIYSDI